MATYRVPALETFSWQQSVHDKDILIPPVSPNKGDRYIIAGTGTGGWAGQNQKIAYYTGAVWAFDTPLEGHCCWVEDENEFYVFNGSTWDMYFGEKGDQGDQGNQGNQGYQGYQGTPGGSLNWHGAWVTSHPYVIDDAVQNGTPVASYRCILGHTAGASSEPDTGGSWDTYWQYIANHGAQGDQGNQGNQGNQGVQGLEGDQGNQGVQGLEGDQGNQGYQGYQGTPGASGDHAALTNLAYANALHTGFEPAITAGTTAQYLRGDKSLGTLNQAAVAGLTTADSPIFVTAKLSGLTDLYVPYHVSDAAGLANSPIQINSGNTMVGIGCSPSAVLHVIGTTEQFRVGYDASYYLKLTVLASAANWATNSSGTIRMVNPGTGNLTTALAALTNGDTIVLLGGTYSESAALAIPSGVLDFSIVGQGIGVTVIDFTANVDGFEQTVTTDRLHQVLFKGFTIKMSGASSAKIAFDFLGATDNSTMSPSMRFQDVSVERGAGANLISNGTFESNTTGWTAVNCTLSIDSGTGVDGTNCLKLDADSGSTQEVRYTAALTTVVGVHYYVSVYIKDGTATAQSVHLHVGSTAGATDLAETSGTTSGTWTQIGVEWVATGTTAYFTVMKNSVSTDYILIDSAVFFGNYFWGTGWRITNAWNVLHDNCFYRGQAWNLGGPDGEAIKYRSCIVPKIFGGTLFEASKGIQLNKAGDSEIEGDSKHGCEGLRAVGMNITLCINGVILDNLSLDNSFVDGNIDPVYTSAFYEQTTTLGYNMLSGCWLGWMAGTTISSHLVLVEGAGTRILDNTITSNAVANNMITIANDVDNFRVSRNTLRALDGTSTGIWVFSGNKGMIDHNVFQGTVAGAGNEILLASGSDYNMVCDNMLDKGAVSDGGTGNILDNNNVI